MGLPITERSDGRSVTQVFEDEGYLGNTRNAMCSRILKQEQGDRFIRELQFWGWDVSKVVGFSANEPDRVHRMIGVCAALNVQPLFPIIREGITKQGCADWCSCTMGVRPSAMYEWAEHANCVGCVKGGKAYWLAVAQNEPAVFAQRMGLEEDFGHPMIQGKGGHVFLKDLIQIGLKRKVTQKEAITIGPCECGD